MSVIGFLSKNGFIIAESQLRKKLGLMYNDFLAKFVMRRQIFTCGRGLVTVGFALYKSIYCRGTRCIRFPRTYINLFFDKNIIDSIEILLEDIRNLVWTGVGCGDRGLLHNNQSVVIDYLMRVVYTEARIGKGTAAALLNMRAGMGKTFVAAGLIDKLRLKTLYIVPKRPLAIQARNDLVGWFGDDSVVIYSKKRTCAADVKVMIIVINSALQQSMTFYDRWGFIVFDEVHAFCSEKRKEIFERVSWAALGMSATTEDRNDNYDIIAHKELAFDGIVRAEDLDGFTYEDVVFDTRARIIEYYGPGEYTRDLRHESTGCVFTHYMHNQYIDDGCRLKMAVSELIALYDWRGDSGCYHNIYVFAEEIRILVRARDVFVAELELRRRMDIVDAIVSDEVDGGEFGMFIGGLEELEMGNVVSRSRILFSTYGYAGTGVSILKMTAMLLLTPRKSGHKQIFARILRRGSDVSIPRCIVDIVDKNTSLRKQYAYREVAYDLYGFKREHVPVIWSNVG